VSSPRVPPRNDEMPRHPMRRPPYRETNVVNLRNIV
jgi:hypothetical protein